MKPGKEEQFEEVLERNRRRLTAIARSYASPEDCEDLFQEILLQIWKSLDGFEGRSSLDTWVYRVALNTAITYRQKTRERARPFQNPGELPESAGPSSSRSSSAGAELRILHNFIHTLNRIDRAVFLLYLEDFNYRQMAEISGLTENNLGVRISRIKRAYIDQHIGA